MSNDERIISMLEKLQGDVSDLRAEMNSRFDGVDQAVKETQTVLVEAVDVVGQKVDNVAQSVSDIKTATAQNSYDVQVLRGKAQ